MVSELPIMYARIQNGAARAATGVADGRGAARGEPPITAIPLDPDARACAHWGVE